MSVLKDVKFEKARTTAGSEIDNPAPPAIFGRLKNSKHLQSTRAPGALYVGKSRVGTMRAVSNNQSS